MKRFSFFVLAFLGISASIVWAQPRDKTGKQYFEEIWSVGGLNPFATMVCYPEQLMDTFFVVGFSGDFGARKKMRLSPQDKKLFEDSAKGKEIMLLWAYIKGVKTQEIPFDKSSRDRTTWSLDWNQDGAIWHQEYSFGFTFLSSFLPNELRPSGSSLSP